MGPNVTILRVPSTCSCCSCSRQPSEPPTPKPTLCSCPLLSVFRFHRPPPSVCPSNRLHFRMAPLSVALVLLFLLLLFMHPCSVRSCFCIHVPTHPALSSGIRTAGAVPGPAPAVKRPAAGSSSLLLWRLGMVSGVPNGPKGPLDSSRWSKEIRMRASC